jgi:hypothetical protein
MAREGEAHRLEIRTPVILRGSTILILKGSAQERRRGSLIVPPSDRRGWPVERRRDVPSSVVERQVMEDLPAKTVFFGAL